MATLGKKQLRAFMRKRKLADRLVVTPLLEQSQIGAGSVDLRVGNDFVLTRRGHLASIDPAKRKLALEQYQYHHHVNNRQKFVLHPGQLVLASSIEYIRLPITLAGTVTSRSRWGRAGLVIATATAIHPGFDGTVTLEMVNLGEVPLIIYPGLRVAQLVLSECKGGVAYDGNYSGQTSPNFPSVDGDTDKSNEEEFEFWIPKNTEEAGPSPEL